MSTLSQHLVGILCCSYVGEITFVTLTIDGDGFFVERQSGGFVWWGENKQRESGSFKDMVNTMRKFLLVKISHGVGIVIDDPRFSILELAYKLRGKIDHDAIREAFDLYAKVSETVFHESINVTFEDVILEAEQ